MANTTAPRNTKKSGDHVWLELLSLPQAASKVIYPGSMVAVDASGNALSAGDANAKVVMGVYRGTQTKDNTGGAAGAINCEPIESGCFWFGNSSSADAIAAANIGGLCYVADDQTVALTDNNGARLFAGIIMGVDATDGVLVLILPEQQNPVGVISFGADFTAFANATLFTFTPTFSGRISKISLTTAKAATGAGATCTITPNIAAVALTGGVLTPTLANQNAAGNELAATAITGANRFNKGQAITLVGSSTTAFTAGSGTIYLQLG